MDGRPRARRRRDRDRAASASPASRASAAASAPRALGPWGEPIIKAFVQESIAEALKLETALARLRSTRACGAAALRAGRLHGRGRAARDLSVPRHRPRLEEPLVRYEVDVVFHGHAHHGQPEGRTSAGAPVFNVSLPLLSACSRSSRFGASRSSPRIRPPLPDLQRRPTIRSRPRQASDRTDARRAS